MGTENEDARIIHNFDELFLVVRGYLSLLDDRDREIFIQSLDKHEKEDELPFNMDLQVNVIHTARIIKYAEIVGEGAPRKGKTCVPLKDILGQLNATLKGRRPAGHIDLRALLFTVQFYCPIWLVPG